MRTSLWLIIVMICFPFVLQAQKENKNIDFQYSGFSGGMAFYTGYLYAGTPIFTTPDGMAIKGEKVQGAPFGMGGALKLHFGHHFRIGGEGYNCSLIYGKNKNRWNLSWGGLLIDGCWSIKKWELFIGGTIGFGTTRHLIFLEANPLDFQIEAQSVYRKYSTMMLVPFMGIAYSITEKMCLYLKWDYAFPVYNRQSDFAEGLRVYVGFSFYHKREKTKQNSTF